MNKVYLVRRNASAFIELFLLRETFTGFKAIVSFHFMDAWRNDPLININSPNVNIRNNQPKYKRNDLVTAELHTEISFNKKNIL